MENVLIILAVVISVLLVIVVLIQKSKGGGLASNFSGSNQIMGVRRTNDFIEKTTWTLATCVAVLAIISGMLFNFAGKKETTTLSSGEAQQEAATPFETPAAEADVQGDFTTLPATDGAEAAAGEADGAAEQEALEQAVVGE